MFKKVLLKLREKVRKREYVMTIHARKEMHADGFSLFDIESGVLSGEILERQKDLLTRGVKVSCERKNHAQSRDRDYHQS